MTSVAIIGAGGSGLVSIKTCLEEGLKPVCFEKTSHIGGLWHFSEEPRTDPNGHGAPYKELYMNTSKEMSAFSDFPPPKELPPYLKVHDMYRYYISYAEHFDLLKHITFNAEVVAVDEADDYSETGRWRVTVREASGRERTEVFDGVVVCSGMHSTGVMPSYPGLDEFQGEVIHSRQVRKGSDYEGKSILVVGPGLSGGDISALCSNHARQVYLSMRGGTWILPRWIDKQPLDTTFNMRWKSWIPGHVQGDKFQSKLEALYDPTDLGIRSHRHVLTVHPIMNDTVSTQIMNGSIVVRGGVRSFEGSKVNFTDGSSVPDIDVVIFATGYDVKFPFFKKEVVKEGYSQLRLYLQIVPPRLIHPTMAFVGFEIPYSGGQNSLSEMQVRYATKVIKKEVKLPPVEEMEEEITTRMNAIYAQFGNHYPFAVNPTAYKDVLAEAIGALPSLTRLFLTDPKLAYHYYFGPAYPPCYRLVGPGAKPDAREAFLQCGANQFHGVTVKTVRSDAMDKLRAQGRRNGSWSWYLPALIAIVILSLLLYV